MKWKIPFIPFTKGDVTKSPSSVRVDSFANQFTGKGGNSDKLSGITANKQRFTPQALRDFYLSSGFIQNIVNALAEDALREWFVVKTNRDEDLNISRILENRFTELKLSQALESLIRYSRIYCEGAVLFFGITEDIPRFDLSMPISTIRKLEFLNVIGADSFTLNVERSNPLSKNYNLPTFYVGGIPIHKSRLEWVCNGYLPEENRGISVVQSVLDAIYAQDAALWSVTSLLEEMAITVFKSPNLNQMNPTQVAEFLRDMKMVMNTQSAMALSDGEDITKKTISIPGIKEIFDYIFDNLAGLSKTPKSRLMGQAQGTITAGKFDTISYYDTVARFQENTLKPIIEKVIKMIVFEQNGEISRTLGGDVNSLDWEIEFNPLWKLGPLEDAEVKLKQAQADQIYLTTGVLSPDDVRKEKFQDLESFGTSNELDFSVPDPSTSLRATDDVKAGLDLSLPITPNAGTSDNAG